MYDASLVGVMESVAELFDEVQPLGIRKRDAALDDAGERLAFDELHDDERLVLVHSFIEHDGNVWMGQACRGGRFALKTFAPVSISCQLRVQ